MKKKTKQEVDWGGEMAHSVGIVGRVFGKLLSYLLNIILTVLLICLITGTIVGCAFAFYVKNYIDVSLDDFADLSTDSDRTTSIYYMDWTDRDSGTGTPVEITDQRLYGSENRIWVSYQQIPKNLINAFIAVEDHRFPTHKGVDWVTTIRATARYFTGNKIEGGGSTITQQLIKNVTGDNEVTIQRKVQEILRALEIEKNMSKEEILELYLNKINLSHGCYGVGAAAYTYFGKEVQDLTLLECAAIAGITQSPSHWDPIYHPENNTERRNTVLYCMYEYGYITKEEYYENKNAELTINYQARGESTTTTNINTWYTDAAFEEAIDLLMEAKGWTDREYTANYIYTAGLQIITAQDPEIQRILDEYFVNDSNFISVDNSAIQPEASMVIIDPKTGDVLGIAGGRGEKRGNRILNYATQTTRSPGSSIKPLSIYGPALEYGVINYGSVVDDSPVNFGDPVYENGELTGYTREDGYPQNYSNTYRGLTTINYAVTNSLNTVAYKVLQMLTLDTSFDFVKNKLHLDNYIEYAETAGGVAISDKDYSALALGGMNYGVTVLEMTAAYQIFANNGVYNKPRIVLEIRDSSGKTIIKNERVSEIVISDQTASIMTKLLQNVVQSGTAASVTCKNIINVAGKTGTTTDDRDRWFIGYTPYYLGGVWFGYSMPRSLSAFSASKSPATKIWDDIMIILNERKINQVVAKGEGIGTFATASGIVTAEYCKDSGKLVTDACRADPRGSRVEVGYFTSATVPTEPCDCHTIVAFDRTTGGVASASCPESNTARYGLIKVDSRDFPVQVSIADAQYTCRDLGSTPICSDPNLPYYAGVLGEGHYSGVTGKGAVQFNRGCTHTGAAEQEEETGDGADGTGETDTGEDVAA